jgi:hypothetical protein
MGDEARAGRVAHAYLSVMAARDHGPKWDLTLPSLEGAAVRAGLRSAADARADRARLFTGWVDLYGRTDAWVLAYAGPAATRAEAEDALANAPDSFVIDKASWDFSDRVAIGKVYMLAGRAADALPWLEAAAASCAALDSPLLHTQAAWLLGRAREDQGDRAGACAAYGVVVERWGRAIPRSVTGAAAVDRRRALACPD